jgi:hypothetical protein
MRVLQQQPEMEDEAGKREALAEALSEFCSVVRRGQPQRHDEQELLSACGKLSMQHLLPVYNVRAQLLPPPEWGGMGRACACMQSAQLAP